LSQSKLNTLETQKKKITLTDGSRLMIEGLAQAGVDTFVAYPITPSNWMYKYGKERFPQFYAAPDEITTLQWMAGLAATGRFVATSSAFPGIALMVESINMAYAMELPMVIIITQRLGPSTGSATTGAQGDLAILNGIISGNFPIPVISPSNFEDAWDLSAKAAEIAVKFRTPVFLLTSKEMVMYQKSFDLNSLKPIEKIEIKEPVITGDYKPYKATKDMVPPFLALGNEQHLTRITASTHDEDANIRKNDPEALANTQRLHDKFIKRIDELTIYDYQQQKDANKLIVTWGITADAARDAVAELKAEGENVDLLVVKALLPVSPKIYEIIDQYDEVIIAEENITGQYKEILFGYRPVDKIKQVNKMGNMITPEEIINIVKTRQ
jgi:2-oxoglutarate ferredoxin oxidoreductase subunit alpha